MKEKNKLDSNTIVFYIDQFSLTGIQYVFLLRIFSAYLSQFPGVPSAYSKHEMHPGVNSNFHKFVFTLSLW